MENEFAKAERYDQSNQLTPGEKVEIWMNFLSLYGSDNPLSTKDDELRQKAEEMSSHWRRDKVASLPRKSGHSPSVQGPSEVGRDGALIAFADGVVRDTKTGLEWIVGPDNDTTWAEAKSWVEKVKSLDISGGGWRMSTADELESLYQHGKGKRNMTPFLKTSGWWVWAG